MKLATYVADSDVKVGAVARDGAHLIDLAAAAARNEIAFRSMLALIEGGQRALDIAGEAVLLAEDRGDHLVALADVRLLAPIPLPPQIRDASVFPTHIRQAPAGMQKLAAALQGRTIPDARPAADVPPVYRQQPIFYFTNRFSIAGPGDEIRWPRYSSYMDFELEVAAIVGRRGKDIPIVAAGDHIFGYTIFNDFSARDAQLVEMQGMLGPAKGKSFDGGNAFGPFIVTKDEIADPRLLKATARVNDETWMSGDLSGMLHSFEEMIAYISRDETLYPGEIIGSGTVGNGCGLEQFRFLQDGDTVELEVEMLGTLRNRVRRQHDAR
jgi:2-keto-4-pentenoate hydratase/2-oxohepta-3-ene-1,7-dioic acid hydratase in catechol pathway